METGLRFNLVKFNGDSEMDGQASAIISWNYGDVNHGSKERVVRLIRKMTIPDLMYGYTVYNKQDKRFVTTYVSTGDGENVVITIDALQDRISVVTSNSELRMLHKVVDYILHSGYNRSIKCYIKKLIYKRLW